MTYAEMVAGLFFARKYRRLALQHGVFLTAKRMRKDGVPIQVALSVLLGA